LLEGIRQLLKGGANAPGMPSRASRYCELLFEYDEGYNDWSDYSYCLQEYVKITALVDILDERTRHRVAEARYTRLSMCGRYVGDSWYTTNKVYES